MKPLFFLLLLLSAPAFAQQWSGIIDPARAITWGAGVTGGIPSSSWTQCGSTIAAYTGTGTTINNALAACTANHYVLLGAGTFNLSTGIFFPTNANSIALRGSGPDSTFIKFTGAAANCTFVSDICVDSNGGYYAPNPNNFANWTAGYARAATSITVSAKTGMSVGTLLILTQCNTGYSGSFAANGGCGTAGAIGDNGTEWVCDDSGASTSCATEGGEGISAIERSQSQAVTVTSISGGSCPCTIGITPGLYMDNWASGSSPAAYWGNSTIINAGIENLSLDESNDGGSTNGILLMGIRDSWISNVRGVNSNRAQVSTNAAGRITIRDSYFFGTQNGVSQSYGIETNMSSDILAENNMFQKIALPVPMGKSTAGDVVDYNFAINDYFLNGAAESATMQGYYHHASGMQYNIFEGDIGPSFEADAIHGTQQFATIYRNRLRGWEPGKTAQTVPITIWTYNRYFNLIGNILGDSSYHTAYECFPAAASTAGPCAADDQAIFSLGWSFPPSKDSVILNDTNVRASVMRWGNYDTVNAAVQWSSSEVPSGLSFYANAVPGNHNLPASFVYSSEPRTWWKTPFGTPPWPPIGPDVTSGNLPLAAGFANYNPAGLCFQNTGMDSAYNSASNQGTITTTSESGNTVTLNFGSALPAQFSFNSEVLNVSGVGVSGYNGRFQILSNAATSLTYYNPTSGLGASSGGTATVDPVLLFNATGCYQNDPAAPSGVSWGLLP